MSRLFLVRHGQASFLEADYDKLSPLGEIQSRLLGKFWAARKIRFDRVATGPRARQKNTARIVTGAYRQARQPFPEAFVVPEFDEYDGEGLLRRALPQLLESDEKIRGLYRSFQASSAPAERSKQLQKLLEVVVIDWVNGGLVVPGIETWPEFRDRVNNGLTQFISQCGHGVTGAIFCSGGPIAIAVERALHLQPLDTLRIMWISRNASCTDFLFSGDRFTLSAFNSHPHLDDASLLTYR